MHIPNGFLTDPVCAVTAAVATVGVGASAYRILTESSDQGSSRKQYGPVMAALGAGILAVQAINFRIDPGTSGHLLGAALAAALIGPARATLTMTLVLVLQCVLLGDGGVAAIGANILNMAIIAPWTAWLAMSTAKRSRPGRGGWLAGAAVAGFFSVIAAALACSVELAVAGAYPLAQLAAAMLQAHWVPALCESAVTVGVVGLVAARAAAIPAQAASTPSALEHSNASFWLLAAVIALVALATPWASSLPDGMTRVADDLGLAGVEGTALLGESLGAICLGVLATFAVARLVERRLG